jgi:xylan 1,4-beta-xylosidase
MKKRIPFLIATVLLARPLPVRGQPAKTDVAVHVHVDERVEKLTPIWNYFGYDEPNYTYAPHGQKLLREIAAVSSAPIYIRVHNLLTTGDGSASLKWGSTNAYTERGGDAVYNWAIVDRIFDTFHAVGLKPLVEIGFMPEALSTHPEPYRHAFPHGSIFTGWAYPPNNYDKWSELVFEFARHLRERYGDRELKTWLWEVWNEPDIDYWKGTPEEYFKLYDYTANAILRALPQARVGGPDSTGPASPKAADFLRHFLDHCAHGKNYVTREVGSPLQFISFHPKGAPKWNVDHVQMGMARHLASVDEGFRIVKSFPEYENTPVVLGESDPEGCAACSAKGNPQNSYRNGPLFASYTAEVMNDILGLVKQAGVNFLGAVTWSFEFEDQPYFEGYRELATNGIDKPVLNTFRMLGMLGEEYVNATSSGAVPVEDVLRNGVRTTADINAIASRRDREVEVLLWNYHDDDVAVPDTQVDLTISGIEATRTRAFAEHFRIDSNHSNAYAIWKQMGSPQQPSPGQYLALDLAGQLQLLTSPAWVKFDGGTIHMNFALPRQAVSLLRISW